MSKVAFTRIDRVGKMIVQASAGNLKKVMLELGGKSPVLIFDDADLDKAIFGAAMGIFVHSGQGLRVRFANLRAARGVRPGCRGHCRRRELHEVRRPGQEGVMSGPLISAKQLDRVAGVHRGGQARRRRGGHRRPPPGPQGATSAPDRADECRSEHAPVPTGEIFPAPSSRSSPFDDGTEAIAMANDTTCGLAGTVWTTNISRGHRLVNACTRAACRSTTS